jgi:NACHT domain-containing protein/NACHT conflict system protein
MIPQVPKGRHAPARFSGRHRIGWYNISAFRLQTGHCPGPRTGTMTAPPIDDQVVDFYQTLFDRIFSAPFQGRIKERLKRNAVVRQVQESADAASQSLARLLVSQQLTEEQASEILGGFTALADLLDLEQIGNPNVTPESLVDRLLERLPPPKPVEHAQQEPVYRVALHSVIQVLMLVGPVMAEWQKLNFSTTFELPRRVVSRLNQISEVLGDLGRAGEAAADKRYELSYRDYLLQRFHRVEAGTVKMTTNLDVDLRELFVMPRLAARPTPKGSAGKDEAEPTALLDLATARQFFEDQGKVTSGTGPYKKSGMPALEVVQRFPRNVIVGPPGSGKSTFLEWLQLKLAAVEEELVMAGQQAIPLLLRVRQFDPRNLPRGAALIEKATASRDRATLMPPGWIERQMRSGRVLLMLDGLDETEPELRDSYVLPWLRDLCKRYPYCRFLVSSRPVGYPPGALRKLEFTECDLLDFGPAEIAEYTRHWCTAIRLAHNEPEKEARREGAADGKRIVDGFKGHPYINNLARNPLMLSAISLVNYFEGGQLPKDRAVLYRLCVEGLLHHWDQRRGIQSEFTLEEKLRACREVALDMQSREFAEFKAEDVRIVFEQTLHDSNRSRKLLEHIRYRTGLLLERRSGIFAFAHLTFQEYLAASAINEGNRLGIDGEQLAREHDSGRWNEVIALYCGLAPAPTVRQMIELLVSQPDTITLSGILAEAFLSAGAEIPKDHLLRRNVLHRIAVAPRHRRSSLSRFALKEVTLIATNSIGRIKGDLGLSEAHGWLQEQPEALDSSVLLRTLSGWSNLTPVQISELVHLIHLHGPDSALLEVAADNALYGSPGPRFRGGVEEYSSQAGIALIGLGMRSISFIGSPGVDAAWLRILEILTTRPQHRRDFAFLDIERLLFKEKRARLPKSRSRWPHYASLARQVSVGEEDDNGRKDLLQWASALDENRPEE